MDWNKYLYPENEQPLDSFVTDGGFTGAALHMLFHGVIKITLFFCVGAILYRTGAEYLNDIHGYSKRMPVIMSCYTVCGLGLIGVCDKGYPPNVEVEPGHFVRCFKFADKGTEGK